MSLIIDKCIEYNDTRKICVASEMGKKYTLNNTSNYKIRKIKVDRCLAQSIGEKRCDFLMNTEDEKLKRVFFIELKGGGLTHALKQLYSTIIYLREEFANYQVDARIVGSKDVPGFINTPEYLKLYKIVNLTNGTIIKATNKIYSENI